MTETNTNETQSAGRKAASDVSALLRARNPLLWITTKEEARVERLLMDAAQSAAYVPVFWDCATGISDYSGQPLMTGKRATDPQAAFSDISNSVTRQVWIMRDLHKWLLDPTILRGIRTLSRQLPLAEREQARAIIILSPSSEIPPELAGHAIAIDWPLPDRTEIAELLDSAIDALPDDLRENAATNGSRDASIDAAVGLTAEEAQSCFAKSLVSTRRIDPAQVAQEKRRVIAREKVLEWFDPIPEGLDAVGGLDELKNWLRSRRAAFSPKAKAYGLPAPKGCLLVGVPGCGKSLTAKAIATAWGMPLLKLDMGALKSKYVGESESNIRKALKVAETVAPCVLWLDEIEKAMAGATQGAADGGVSSDALGTILTWMQDRAGSVFVVATANDVKSLPPALLRKGRFDELFFVDLPNKTERVEILRAALRSHKRDKVDGIEIETLADKDTQDFTGSEIAALIPEALYAAFADGEREIETNDIAKAAATTVPLAKTSAEQIAEIRKWAIGRARNASVAAAPQTTSRDDVRALDI